MKHQQSGTRLFSAFPATNWNWVADVGSEAGGKSQQALALLCEGYWYPIYAFLRSKGHAPHDAEDLAQGFFERLIKNNGFAQAQQSKGRLRNFLLAGLQNFVFTEHQSAHALKRGQGAAHLPIHLAWAEERFGGEQLEPRHEDTPEDGFNRRWWALVIEQSMVRVRDHYLAQGKEELFQALSPLLDSGRAEAGSYKALAQRLSMSEPALRVAYVRMKQRVSATVRQVLLETVGDAGAVEEELSAMTAFK